jgi:hypothetical protein
VIRDGASERASNFGHSRKWGAGMLRSLSNGGDDGVSFDLAGAYPHKIGCYMYVRMHKVDYVGICCCCCCVCCIYAECDALHKDLKKRGYVMKIPDL